MSFPKLLQNGRYDVLKKLGEGGKGMVYKARDTVLNRVVAIKMLKSEVLSEEAYSRFIREAQAVAKLNHPNVVSIYDVGKEDEKQFFVLEFVDGMSLRDLMRAYPEGKCDIQTILRTSIDVCSALQYAHSQGVLHGDIKPENILITPEGTAKLVDFGLAKMLRQPSVTQEEMLAFSGRIPTGYEEVDSLLLGGIPENYAVILTSPSCDKRDLLIKKFLETGARKGEGTFYVTIDPGEAKALAQELQSNFYLFVCNPQADRIIESLPNVFKLKGVENLTDINIALTSAFRKLDASLRGSRRICIEIVSDVLLQHHAVHTRRWLTGLIPELKSEGFTILAVMNPHMHPSEEVQAILGLFDGEMDIYEKETEKGFEKILRTNRMPLGHLERESFTVSYVAPEKALGKDTDARSDLYSFGAVLYEMATGKTPFLGEDPVKIIFSHIHDQPVPASKLNPKVPQALAECIMKLLEKDPGKRYQTAADLLKALKDVAEDFSREVIVPSPRPTAVKEGQLVDRAEEMVLLRETVDRAVRGEGGVVFLYGEAGIGKTRLASELRAYARLRGMQVLSGKCPASFRVDGVPPPYVLWKEVIKNYLEVCTPEQLYKVIGPYPGEVSKLVPELSQKLGAISPSVPISPEYERDRLFEAVTQFITNISKKTPLLIVLDDLQWTDQSSLLLLHYLARDVYREPLLLLGAYRDTDVDERHPLSFVLTELKRERLLQSVPLKRISFDDISEMIKRILKQDNVPREFCELVYEKTRGNPYFVEEMIASLKEEEIVYYEKDKWRFREVSRVKFPKTVREVITQRIGRLDDECKNVLTLASFVGKDFTFQSLTGVTDVEEDKVLEIMERILKTGLVKERVIRGEDVFSFADVMVRDVLHEDVSHLRHKRLHGVIGRALEKVHAEKIDEHLGELAYHFLESGDKEKALDYFLKAGDRAMKIHANEEASSYFEAALNLLDETGGDVREKARVAEALGDLKNWNMEFEPSIEYFDEALVLLKETGDKIGQARLYRKKAEILTEALGRREDGLAQISDALKILENEPESLELAWVYWEMAHVQLGFFGNLSKAIFLGRRALSLAEKLGVLEVKAKCYIELLFTELVDLQKATKYAEEGLKIAVENNYPATAAYGYFFVPVYRIALGEFQRAIKLEEEGLEFARKVGVMTWSGIMMGTLTWIYQLARGDLQKAIETAEEVIHRSKKTGFLQAGVVLTPLAWAYQTIGEWEKAYEYYVQSLDFAERMHHHFLLIQTRLGLGRLFYEKEEYGKSEEILQKAVEIIERIRGKIRCPAQIPYAAFVPYIWLSELHIKMGKFKEAKVMADQAYEVAVESKSRFYVAMANRLNGMLFSYQKDWKSAIESFERSKREFEAMGALFDLIPTLYEYGLTYQRRNQEGDREKAQSLLDQALEISQKIGAKKWIEKMIAKKKLLTA